MDSRLGRIDAVIADVIAEAAHPHAARSHPVHAQRAGHAVSGEGIESVDEKLTAAFERREQAQDDLIRALTAIDTATTRIAVLIDRKLEARKKAAT